MNDEQARRESGTDAGPAQGKQATEAPRRNPAGDALPGEGVTRVVTMVCELCGKDYSFEDGPPPGIRCDKCGNQVFRQFDAVIGDDAADDFRDSTERDLDPDDPEGDTLPGDVLDLNRL